MPNQSLENKRPKIIGVLPIHNGLPYVLDAIQSILEQKEDTFDLEIIVSACGTTDASIETIEGKYPSVRVVRGPDSEWWTGAIKIGTKKALDLGADYVFWMNHDDILEYRTIGRLLRAAQSKPQSIPCSILASPDRQSAVCGFKINYFKWYSQPIVAFLKETQTDDFRMEADVNGGHGILIPRKVFESSIGLDVIRPDLFPHYSGDFDFFMRARSVGYQACSIGGTLIRNNPKTTGILQGQRIQRIAQIPSYLFSRRSPCNLRDRPLFAMQHFPLGLNIIWAGILLIVPVLCAIFYRFRRATLGPLDCHPMGSN